MDPLVNVLAASPALFPHDFALDSGAVQLIRLGERDLERASFLDARILSPGLASRTVAWDLIAEAAAPLPERCQYIFHTGHVGSTLISRLLGAHPALLSLREPQILRRLAEQAMSRGAPGWDPGLFEARAAAIVKLLSRSFRPEQMPLVKTTSYVSELSQILLSRAYAPRALMLHVSAENFLATILGAENSPLEAQLLAPERRIRLQRRLGCGDWPEEVLSPGETVAMGWACEMTALQAGAEAAGTRAIWLDFDDFLAAPHQMLARLFAHFGVAAEDARIDAILAGPTMGRYAKAPEHPFDASVRAGVLAEARAQAGEEIARGMAWLQRAAAEYPAIAAVLAR